MYFLNVCLSCLKISKMQMTVSNINWFLLAKLPAAYLCRVRLKEINDQGCVVRIRESWINRNPFNSIYFAAQSMAAELSTGTLVMKELQQSGHAFSMLITTCKMNFVKKAKGEIIFSCHQGEEVRAIILAAIKTNEGKVLTLKSQGVNDQGEIVSEMMFEWSIKLKSTNK